MKRYGGIALFFFTLLLMSVLSILQGTNAREKLALAGSLPSGSRACKLRSRRCSLPCSDPSIWILVRTMYQHFCPF